MQMRTSARAATLILTALGLLAFADGALYQAKHAGRNCVKAVEP